MKILVENIGSLDRADIEIANLTVISGENDSGKTTISKIVYAIGQAASSFSIDYRKYQYLEIRRLYEELYFVISRYIKVSKDHEEKTNNHYLFEDENPLLVFFSNLRKSANYGDFSSLDYDYIMNRIDLLYKSYTLPEQAIIAINSILERLQSFYSYKDKEPIDKFIFRALKNEFLDETVKKDSQRDDAYLSLTDGESTIFELNFTDKRVLRFSGDTNIRIQDTTLVEGPAIFQLAAAIRESMVRDTFRQRNNNRTTPLPYHIIDLCSKLDGTNQNFHYVKDDFCRQSDWTLCDFYDGSFEYQRHSRNFVLNKNGHEYFSTNVSSGMKAVAILDLLVKGEYINKNTILILDEPETNLHPKWQKKYAKAIVNLAAMDTKILINTHSPYMLEALKFYSDSHLAMLNSKFYFSYKRNNSIIIDDTQGNIVPIIEVLSAPLNDLMEEMQGNVDDF